MAVQGLDRATAPPADQAKRMLHAIGGRWWNVYIGGPQSGGHGWTPALVADYVRHGIGRFMLTYVGRQKGGPLTRAQGEADGHDALAIAKTFGYTGGFPLCLDVELSTFESAPAKTVEYARAWCAAVRQAGTRPGVYANPAPLKAMAAGNVGAEFVWVASWLGHSATAHDPHAIPHFPAELWSGAGARAWQYAGAFDGKACKVLGLDVDISVADLGCLAEAPGGQPAAHVAPAAGGTVLRLGDTGPQVRRLTRRLSYVRSRATHAPYLDGARRKFDHETAVALRAFQREHGLVDDAKFGKLTREHLRKEVAKEKDRRKKVGVVTPHHAGAKVPAATARVDLKALTDRVLTTDRTHDAALEEFLAYGLRRRRLLQRLEEARATSTEGLLTEIVRILKAIEDDVGDLVEAEEHQPAVTAQHPAAVGTQSASAAHGPAGESPPSTESPAGIQTAPGPQTTTLPVAQMEQIPHAVTEGPAHVPVQEQNGAGVVAATAGLASLSDRAVALLIRDHGQAIDAAYGVLAERFKRYDAAIARLRPPGTHGGGSPGRGGRTPDKGHGGDKDTPGKGQGGGKGGAVADVKLGDQAHMVRASKIALARFLAAKGNQEHTQLRRALKRDARLRKRGETATRTWEKAVRAVQHLARLPATGVMDGELQHLLQRYWPTDSGVRRFMRATPGWRLIKGQVSPNFNLREFACKDGTAYVNGLVREQGLSKEQAKRRAGELAKRLERVRKAGGGRTLHTNSVFRTKAHNRSVGGASNSAHMRGFAADIQPPAGVALETHRQHVRAAFEAGVGFYPHSNFVHGDFDMGPGMGTRNWTG